MVHTGDVWEESKVNVETPVESVEPAVHTSDLVDFASSASTLATPHTLLQTWHPLAKNDTTGFQVLSKEFEMEDPCKNRGVTLDKLINKKQILAMCLVTENNITVVYPTQSKTIR
jgi:hypothetical protein